MMLKRSAIANIFFGILALLSFAITTKYLLIVSEYPDSIRMIYFSCGMGIVFLVVALTKINKAKFSLVLFSVYIAFFFLNLFFPTIEKRILQSKSKAQILQKVGLAFDSRTQLEVVKDLNEKGETVYPTFMTQLLKNSVEEERLRNTFNLMPLGGMSDVKTVFCNESGEFVTYHADKFGFRNSSENLERKSVDIMLIGDSFTHGACVPEGSDINSYLNADGYNALNFGMNGDGPLSELGTLIEYGIHFKPKNLVWIFYDGNDISDLNWETFLPILTRYYEQGTSQNLFHRQEGINQYWRNYYTTQTVKLQKDIVKDATNPESGDSPFTLSLMDISRLISLYDVRVWTGLARGSSNTERLENERKAYENHAKALSQFGQIVKKAKTLTESWDGRFCFVYIPNIDSVLGSITDPSRIADIGKASEVLKLLKELNIPTHDFSLFLAGDANPARFIPLQIRGHFNEIGYREMASHIEKNCLSP